MIERPSAVVDLDGPLLDGRKRHHACYQTILADQGFRALDLREYWIRKRAGYDRQHLLAATGAGAIYNVFLAQWMDRIEDPGMLDLDRVQPGAIDTLRRWRAAGLGVVIATHRRDRSGLLTQMDRLGLLDHVDEVVTSHPDGGAEGKAASTGPTLGLRACEGVWIGDTVIDIEAARVLGRQAWAVSCGLRSKSVLERAAPDILAENLEDLPTPLSDR